jgi:hypothetical protein
MFPSSSEGETEHDASPQSLCAARCDDHCRRVRGQRSRGRRADHADGAARAAGDEERRAPDELSAHRAQRLRAAAPSARRSTWRS